MDIIGQSKAIVELKELIKKVASTNSTVLILGESGTGKELVANHIHQASIRNKAPFIPLNCAAIPAELLESELFGHEKGAFTGATHKKIGKFEHSSTGTIFLDEIGDMPAIMQVKLLRVLQEKTFTKIGGNDTITTGARVITATNKNLEQLVSLNKFREDLFYRINVFPIYVPPLRDRKEDVESLITHYQNKFRIEMGLEFEFSVAVIEMLSNYDWPGNIRELSNLVERLGVLHNGKEIIPDFLPEEITSPTLGEQKKLITVDPEYTQPQNLNLCENFDLKKYLSMVEVKFINKALKLSNNIVSKAARNLGLRRTTLIEKIRKYNINRY